MTKLPILEHSFSFTPDAKTREVFHSFTRGLCPHCHKAVDGVRVFRDDKVYMRKQCPEHGQSEALISGQRGLVPQVAHLRERRLQAARSTRRRSTRAAPTIVACVPDHEQHSCLPIIEITNHCNLECPICIVQNRNNYNMTTEPSLQSILDGLVEKEGVPRDDQPLGRRAHPAPRLPGACSTWRVAKTEISRVSISTNGLRCATDLDFCKELADKGVYVSLQLDAMSNPALRVLRGPGDQRGCQRARAREPREGGSTHHHRVDHRKGRERRPHRRVHRSPLRQRLHPLAHVPTGGVTPATAAPISRRTIPWTSSRSRMWWPRPTATNRWRAH